VQVLLDDQPGMNVDHVAEHGLTPDEVDPILLNQAIPTGASTTSGNPCKFGWTPTGKYICVVFLQEKDVDPTIVIPLTAFEVPPPRFRKKRGKNQ
jgi:hypothetical protein